MFIVRAQDDIYKYIYIYIYTQMSVQVRKKKAYSLCLVFWGNYKTGNILYDENPNEKKTRYIDGKIMGFKCFFVPTLFQIFWMYIGLCWNVDICHRVCVLYKKQKKKQKKDGSRKLIFRYLTGRRQILAHYCDCFIFCTKDKCNWYGKLPV